MARYYFGAGQLVGTNRWSLYRTPRRVATRPGLDGPCINHLLCRNMSVEEMTDLRDMLTNCIEREEGSNG